MKKIKISKLKVVVFSLVCLAIATTLITLAFRKETNLEGIVKNAVAAGSTVNLDYVYMSGNAPTGGAYKDLAYLDSSITLKIPGKSRSTISGNELVVFKTSAGNYAYCIEMGTYALNNYEATNRSVTLPTSASFWTNLSQIKKDGISNVSIYGFPNKTRSGYTSDEQYAATQILIWEFQQGLRNNYSSIPSDTRFYDVWVKPSWASKIKTVYESILSDISSMNTVPSFTKLNSSDAANYTLKYNTTTKLYETTIADSNNKLSVMSIECPTNISCTVSGSNLKITSSTSIKNPITITMNKNLPNESKQDLLVLASNSLQNAILGRASTKVVSYAKITAPSGNLKIKKTSEDNEIENVEFKIEGPITQTLKTDAKGEIYLNDIPLGNYTITELNAPTKYESQQPITITIAANETKEVGFNNVIKNTSSVKAIKTDLNGIALKGAKLAIKDSKGNIVEEWTSDGEYYTLKKTLDLNEKYTLTEISAPNGYVKGGNITFTITSKNQTVSLEMKNAPTKTEILKTDEQGKVLEGATLQILDSTGKEIDKWVSDENAHVIENLVIGDKYTLKELTAPLGYKLTKPVEFIVQDSNLTTVKMKDELTETEISKTDATTGEEIAGAHLQVIDKNNIIIDEWDSQKGESHIIKGLAIGDKYTLRETISPSGYAISKDVEFIVSNKETTKVEMKNDFTETIISKTDATTGKEIAGAHLQLLDKDNKLIEEWDSEENQSHKIKGLIAGEMYTLKETIAPEGYTISNDVKFTVDSNNQTKVEMKNEYTKVIISKKDVVSSKEIAGAKLSVKDSQGNVVEEWISEENKSHEITKLKVGETYILTEISTPKNYTKAQSIEFTIKETEKIKKIVMFDTPIVYVPNTNSIINIKYIIIGALFIILGIAGIIFYNKRLKNNE